MIRLASGTPFTLNQTGLDLNFDGFGEGRPVVVDRAVLGRSVDDPATATDVLPRTAFRACTIGDTLEQVVPRNSFFGDGLDNVDIGLYKAFRFANDHALTLRVEVYNLFDTVQYGFPITDIGSATFGQISSTHVAYLPRTAQIALRYRF